MSKHTETNFLKQSSYDKEFRLEAREKLARLGEVLIFKNSEGFRVMAKEKIPETPEDCRRDVLQAMERMKLNHPHLLKMYDYSAVHENGKYCIKGYYELPETNLAADLEQRKEEGAYFSADELRNLLVDVLEIVGFLKEKKMIHGDIRPEYVMFDNETQIYKLADRLGDPSPPTKVQMKNLTRNRKLYLSPQLFFNLFHQMKQTPGFESLRLNPYLSEGYSLGLVMLEAGLLEDVQDVFDLKEGKVNENALALKIENFTIKYQDRDIGLVRAVQDLLEINEEDRPDLQLLLTGLKSTPQDSEVGEGEEEEQNYIFRDNERNPHVIEERTEDEEDDLPAHSDRDLVDKHQALKKELEQIRSKMIEDEENSRREKSSSINNPSVKLTNRSQQAAEDSHKQSLNSLASDKLAQGGDLEGHRTNKSVKDPPSHRNEFLLHDDKQSSGKPKLFEDSLSKAADHQKFDTNRTTSGATDAKQATGLSSKKWEENLENLRAQRDELVKTFDKITEQKFLMESTSQNKLSKVDSEKPQSNIFKPEDYSSFDDGSRFGPQKTTQTQDAKLTTTFSKQTLFKEDSQTKTSSLTQLHDTKDSRKGANPPDSEQIKFDYDTEKYKVDKHASGAGSDNFQSHFQHSSRREDVDYTIPSREPPSYKLPSLNNREAISFHDPLEKPSSKYESNPFRTNDMDLNFSSKAIMEEFHKQPGAPQPQKPLKQPTAPSQMPSSAISYLETEKKYSGLATSNYHNLTPTGLGTNKEVSPSVPSKDFSSSSLIRDMTPGKPGEIGISMLENCTPSMQSFALNTRTEVSPRPAAAKDYDTSPQLKLVRDLETHRGANDENRPPPSYTPIRSEQSSRGYGYPELSPIFKDRNQDNSDWHTFQPPFAKHHLQQESALNFTQNTVTPVQDSRSSSINDPSNRLRDISPLSTSHLTAHPHQHPPQPSNYNLQTITPGAKDGDSRDGSIISRNYNIEPARTPLNYNPSKTTLTPDAIQFKQTSHAGLGTFTASSQHLSASSYIQQSHSPSFNQQTISSYPPGTQVMPMVITKHQELDLRPIVIRSRSNTPIRSALSGLSAIPDQNAARDPPVQSFANNRDRSVSPVPAYFNTQGISKSPMTSVQQTSSSYLQTSYQPDPQSAINRSFKPPLPYSPAPQQTPQPASQFQSTYLQSTPAYPSNLKQSSYLSPQVQPYGSYAPQQQTSGYHIPQDAKVLQYVTKTKTSQHEYQPRDISPLRTIKVIRNGVEYNEYTSDAHTSLNQPTASHQVGRQPYN